MNLDIGQLSHLPLAAQVGLVILATFLQEDIAALAAGTAVMEGQLDLVPVAIGVSCGALLANLSFWAAGRLMGTAAFKLPGLRSVEKSGKLEKAREQFRKSGFLAVLVSRFMPGTRIPVCALAGIMGMPFLRYLLYSLLAVLPWAALLLWIPDRIMVLARTGLLWWAVPIVGLIGLLWWKIGNRRTQALL